MASPFPATIPSLVVPLALPIVPRIGPPLTELNFDFTRASERGYAKDGYDMFAALYDGTSEVGNMNGGLLSNEHSLLVPEAVQLALYALARYYALKWSYEQQIPPLPLPENPGIGNPFSAYALDHLDGTARLRGFCAGLAPLSAGAVATVDIGFQPVWATQP